MCCCIYGSLQAYRWPCHTLAFAELTQLIKTQKTRRFARQSSVLIPRPCGVSDKEYLVPRSPSSEEQLSFIFDQQGEQSERPPSDKQLCNQSTDKKRVNRYMLRKIKQKRETRYVHGLMRALHKCKPLPLHMHCGAPAPQSSFSPVPYTAVVLQTKPRESPFNEIRR